MKKILAILLMLAIVPMAYSANPEKQLQKAKEKERKEVMKRFKKEGWQLLGSSHSLEVELLEHWAKVDKSGNHEETGVSTRSKSKSVGQQMAMNQAFVNYAQQAEQTIKGMVATELNGSGIDTDTELDSFYAAYKRELEKEISGELQKSFTIFRENGDGTFEVQTFFVVSDESEAKARKRAFAKAIEESEAAQKHAQKIADMVDKNVSK